MVVFWSQFTIDCSPVSLSDLLSHTLPALPPGKGRQALLAFLQEAVLTADEKPSAGELLGWSRQLEALSKTIEPTEAPRLVGLRENLLLRWPIWGAEVPWGWKPLVESVWSCQPQHVRRWLQAHGAPSGVQLSSHWLSADLGARAPRSVTLLGAALWSPQAVQQSQRALGVVRALLEAGVDPSLPVDSWNQTALEASSVPEVSRLLISSGPSAHRMSFTWMEPNTSLHSAHQHLQALLTACQSAEGRKWLPSLALGFEDLVERTGQRFARLPLNPPSVLPGKPRSVQWMDIAKQVRALGRLVGQDCWRPTPDGISLAGAWARASLFTAVSQPSHFAESKQRLLPMGSDLENPHWNAWGGQFKGIPARVWATLALALRGLARPSSDLKPSPDSWSGVARELEALPRTIFSWRVAVDWHAKELSPEIQPLLEHLQKQMIEVLAPAVPGSLSEEERAALEKEAIQNKKVSGEAVLRMARNATMAVLEKDRLAPGIEVLAERALLLHALTGFRDPAQVQRLATWVKNQQVEVSIARVRDALDSQYAQRTVAWGPGQRQAALDLFLPPGVPGKKGPRF